MDRANAELAAYLLSRGTRTHLVAHAVSAELASAADATVHLAPRPAGSFLLGERQLERLALRVARRLAADHPDTRVVVNGGNCRWADINWVHSVHHAWPCHDRGAPVWFRLKNRLARRLAIGRERRALGPARVIVANSQGTGRAVVDLGSDPARVHVVYLGADPHLRPPTGPERLAARAWLAVPAARPVVAFVGTLGHDNNKGFDTLWQAWRALCARPDWDADLVVAGGGRRLESWRRLVADAGLSSRVRFLGFSDRVPELLAGADLLVSPARYEAYGLNVQEAICRGVPALVSGAAGVAEHFSGELTEMLLPRADDAADLVERLLAWRPRTEYWHHAFLPLSGRLRRHSWTDMAREIVQIAEASPPSGH